MKYGLVNCDIYTGDSVLHDKCILIKGESIADIIGIDKAMKLRSFSSEIKTIINKKLD